MPKKVKERVIKFIYPNNTPEENEEIKKELTETLFDIVYKN